MNAGTSAVLDESDENENFFLSFWNKLLLIFDFEFSISSSILLEVFSNSLRIVAVVLSGRFLESFLFISNSLVKSNKVFVEICPPNS